MVTVRQSGGDYNTLFDAIDANEATIDIDESWTIDDEQSGTPIIDSGNTITITVSGPAQHDHVVHTGTGTWFRYRSIETASFMIECNGAGLIIQGGDFQCQLNGNSDECIRFDANNDDVEITFTDVLMGFDERTGTVQDIVYMNDGGTVFTVTVTNCFFYNASRSAIEFATYDAGSTVDLNCVSTKALGRSNDSGHESGVVGTSAANTMTASAFNCIFDMENGAPFGADTGSVVTLVVDRCITSASSWEADDANWTETITDSPLSRTFTDNASPGAGDFVIVEDNTTSPWDFALQDNATDNDAQDLHADSSGAGITMPDDDVVGTSRPQNTNFDAGFFEVVDVVGGGGPAPFLPVSIRQRKLNPLLVR